MKEPEYVYHCTSLKNLFYLLQEKEPKLKITSKILQEGFKKNIWIRNLELIHFHKKQDCISLSPNKPLWVYGGVCFKIKFKSLKKDKIKFAGEMEYLSPFKRLFGKIREIWY